MALFISFEGGEGSGKTTQVERLTQTLTATGIPTIQLHEPGSTNLGRHIRRLIKGNPLGRNSQGKKETISPTAELFLFAAARAELVSKVLQHQAQRDRLVILADRYADSTTAYQGYGRRLPLRLVEATNRLATGNVTPDLTFLIDVPPSEGLKRVGAGQAPLFDFNEDEQGRMDDESSRRFEEESMAFHERVQRGYHELVRAEPGRWVVVDGLMSSDAVFDAVWETVQSLDKFRALDAAPVMSLEKASAV